ncbi:tocopherol cyclase, chloroplastic-like [Haliotis rubra]|uniref:tocopherol cyclase, chloroplastic-like n=1 Tax=Haliotis rubra TaxID=36100 RepID=UPI001EE504A2|nr:tocopherol cyclase, chloroplastic-like [Haliotis rubra]XP_046556286.1 tocopherol cyclase, chloroplastic-like [Haliotis rubra]XP_046556287.1 tocopherol cyclase, chloroplastic-like [Haliotis rubra]
MTSLSMMLRVTLLFSLYILQVVANQFSPHLFPPTGPYFEGWYMRLLDVQSGQSIGLLFGHVLPNTRTDLTTPLVAASILYSGGCSTCKLMSYNGFFNRSQMSITVNGSPVTKDPDDISPAVFEWSTGKNISFNVKENRTQFNFQTDSAIFRGEISSPIPWGPRGKGPEGWLEHLPLPLHWFVYSLRSKVKWYEFSVPHLGLQVTGKNAVAHMEKNWGKSFPPAWIWAQGVNPTSNVSLSLSGGIVKDIITVTAYLIGYRNPAKQLTLDYTPVDSKVESSHDGCGGSVNLTAIGLVHTLHIHLSSDPRAFSDCLYGPETTGFRRACVESYSATADIMVFKYGRLIDKQHISHYALEFGGKYVCNEKCSS